MTAEGSLTAPWLNQGIIGHFNNDVQSDFKLAEVCDMTVDELIALHPSNPFESEIEGVVGGEEVGKEGLVYIVEGEQFGTPPSEVWSLS